MAARENEGETHAFDFMGFGRLCLFGMRPSGQGGDGGSGRDGGAGCGSG